MAERKATNKYYPPEWDPSKGSLNTFHGSHPLRERASRLRSEGVLVIRFEMPFHIRCLSCHAHIGKGVRYNADKQRTGQYLSTPTFSFTMTCHLCGGRIRVDTDPQLGDYVVKEGGRRIVDSGGEDDERLVVGEDEEERERRESDGLYRLEREQLDRTKGREAQSTLQLLMARSARMKDDFGASQLLRSRMREGREEAGRKLRERTDRGLRMDLVPAREEDLVEAQAVRFGRVETEKEARKRRKRERKEGNREGLGLSKAVDADASATQRLKSQRGVGELTVAAERRGDVDDKEQPSSLRTAELRQLLVKKEAGQAKAEGLAASSEGAERSAGFARAAAAAAAAVSPPSSPAASSPSRPARAPLQSLTAYESDDDEG